MPLFEIITQPPEGQTQTFMSTSEAEDGSTVETERPYMRHSTLDAPNEEVAKRRIMAQEVAIARQDAEGTGQYADDPDGLEAAVEAKSWVIVSSKQLGDEAPAANAPAEAASE